MNSRNSTSDTRCTCGNMRAASRAVTRIYDEALRPSGLRISQYGVLSTVAAEWPVTVSKLAELMDLDRTTVARDLKPLERDGLLCLETCPDDGRVRHVRLTAEGRRRLKTARPLWRQAQARIRRELGDRHVDALLDGLERARRL